MAQLPVGVAAFLFFLVSANAASASPRTGDAGGDVQLIDDLLVTRGQLAHFDTGAGGGHARPKRKMSRKSWRWTVMPIDYAHDASVPHGRRRNIDRVLAAIESASCVAFNRVQLDTQQWGIVFRSLPHAGCSSYLGMFNASKTQAVQLDDGCGGEGKIFHEVGHALGLMHEHQRPDSPQWVTPVPANIADGRLVNFLARKVYETDQGIRLPYDYGSAMHYRANAFAKDATRPALVATNAGYERTMGQRAGASFLDMQAINMAYCGNVCDAVEHACLNKGYQNPRDCSTCLCPKGTFGAHCETTGPDINDAEACGSRHFAGATVRSVTVRTTAAAGDGLRPGAECVYKLAAAQGKQVRMRFAGFFAIQDVALPAQSKVVPCVDEFVEVKTGCDLRPTGYRFCGDTAPTAPASFTSHCGEIVLVVRLRSFPGHRQFTVEFGEA